MVLDNPVVIDWLCRDASTLPILEALIDHENELTGLDVDIAFRKFVFKMDYLPSGPLLKSEHPFFLPLLSFLLITVCSSSGGVWTRVRRPQPAQEGRALQRGRHLCCQFHAAT